MAVPPTGAVMSVVTLHRGSKPSQGMIKQPNVQNWQRMLGWRSRASQLLSGLAATPVSQSLLQASRRHPKRHRVPAGRCRRDLCIHYVLFSRQGTSLAYCIRLL